MCNGVSKRSLQLRCPRITRFGIRRMGIVVARVKNCPKHCGPLVQGRLCSAHPGLFVTKRSRVLGITFSEDLGYLCVGPKTTNGDKFRRVEALMHFIVSKGRVGSLRIVRLKGQWRNIGASLSQSFDGRWFILACLLVSSGGRRDEGFLPTKPYFTGGRAPIRGVH